MTEKIIQLKTNPDISNLIYTPDLTLATVNDLTSLRDDSELIATEYQPITVITLNAGGVGYKVNDVLTVVQSGATGGTVTVTTVAAGVVDGISLTTGGWGYVVENALVTTVAPPGGTGCKINVTAIDQDKAQILEQISVTGGDVFCLFQARATVVMTLGAWGENNYLKAYVFGRLWNDTDSTTVVEASWIRSSISYKSGATETTSDSYYDGSPIFSFLESGHDYIWYLIGYKYRQYKGTSDIELKTTNRKLYVQEIKR